MQAWRQSSGQPVSPSDFLADWLTTRRTRTGCNVKTNREINYSSYLNPGDGSVSPRISHIHIPKKRKYNSYNHTVTYFSIFCAVLLFAAASPSNSDDEADDNQRNQVSPLKSSNMHQCRLQASARIACGLAITLTMFEWNLKVVNPFEKWCS